MSGVLCHDYPNGCPDWQDIMPAVIASSLAPPASRTVLVITVALLPELVTSPERLALVVTVSALPVTFPVNAPAKPVAVNIPVLAT